MALYQQFMYNFMTAGLIFILLNNKTIVLFMRGKGMTQIPYFKSQHTNNIKKAYPVFDKKNEKVY